VSTFDRNQAERFLALLFGLPRTEGWLAGRVGRATVSSDGHEERHLLTQVERCRFLDVAERAVEAGKDVWVCPMPRATKDRRKGNGLSGEVAWADMDHTPTPQQRALIEELGAGLVESGTPGHLHAYVAFAHPTDPAIIEQLNRGLRGALGGDHKWADNSLLRLPGTFNSKPGAGPVRMVGLSPRRWYPDALAGRLGVELNGAGPVKVENRQLKPIEDPQLLEMARDLFDRSKRDYAAGMKLAEAGCSEDQLAWAIATFSDKAAEPKHGVGYAVGTAREVMSDRAAREPAVPEPDRLLVRDVAAVATSVAAAGPPTWLIERLWPADAYGVLGAEDKAGKTWAVEDLAVSGVTGTSWLGHFPVGRGSVVCFLGEGGERQTIRRLAALIQSRGGDLRDLAGLRLCFAVPHLTHTADLAEVRREVDSTRPALVVVDPLYLAARGAKGSDLYGMGEVLEGIQHIAQETDSALAVTTHWNKTGEGSGARRFTGVGPGAWGRVLGSAAVERRATGPDGASTVQLRWEFTGSEIADGTFRMVRRVWAHDPNDLASPLGYEVEVTEEAEASDGLALSRRRVLAVLPEPPAGLSVREIGDRLAGDGSGPPLKRTTIQDALEELAAIGLADAEKPGNGLPNRWWRP